MGQSLYSGFDYPFTACAMRQSRIGRTRLNIIPARPGCPRQPEPNLVKRAADMGCVEPKVQVSTTDYLPRDMSTSVITTLTAQVAGHLLNSLSSNTVTLFTFVDRAAQAA